MNKLYVCDIDQEIHKNKLVDGQRALKEIAEYIIDEIDSTFPRQDFIDWANSDSERPFKHNRKIYYWEK